MIPGQGAQLNHLHFGAGTNLRPTAAGVAGLLLAASLCAAQAALQAAAEKIDSNPPAQPSAATPGQPPPSNWQDVQKQEQTGTSKDRLFYALPNFLTVETENVPPLTPKQKFGVVARSSFDPVIYPWYAFLSGISQAENSEPGYGQGAAGYGQRFGAALADGTIENFLTGAMFPSLLRQDPRFYQSGKGRFWRRTGYSISRMLVTRTDSGQEQFNFSEIIGSAASAGISTYSYHARSDRNLPNAASVWGSLIAYDTLTVAVKEFWPDIRRKLKKK